MTVWQCHDSRGIYWNRAAESQCPIPASLDTSSAPSSGHTCAWLIVNLSSLQLLCILMTAIQPAGPKTMGESNLRFGFLQGTPAGSRMGETINSVPNLN